MLEVKFCNYNKDYQQRLGFLKVVGRVGVVSRGGPEDFLDRLKALYPEGRRPMLPGHKAEVFDPKALLRTGNSPSWIVGFVPKTLDRLVAWAEMVGIIGQSGRLSEWATILEGVRSHPGETSWVRDNPFILTAEERAFFLQLLFVHDQALPALIVRLGQLSAGTAIGVAESNLLIIQSLGDLLDRIRGSNPTELQVRFELRDLLERIGRQYKLADPRKLVNADTRSDTVKNLESERTKGIRVKLPEYHAISRFEQLTDLGLLTKDDPSNPPNDDARERARTSWAWYVTPGLTAAASVLSTQINDLEKFLQNSWMQFCAAGLSVKARELDAFDDQQAIVSLLDESLPSSRRQIGPVQLHTWGSIACLKALGKGQQLELRTVERLLEAMRIDAHTSTSVRLSGSAELRGRTAAVPRTGLSDLLRDHTLRPGDKS